MNLVSRLINKVSRTLTHLSHLSIIEQSKDLQAKVELLRNSQQAYSYTEHPKLSIIVQFFNKKHNISKIIESLRLTSAEEIIVIDDGSVDGSYEDWIKYLDRPNDFLLRCNDLFEVRTYDRALGMARGEFVCLLQDDDIPPPNNIWIEQALTLFDTFPELLILGGRDGSDLLMPTPVNTSEQQEYYRMGDIVQLPGVHKIRLHLYLPYLEPTSGIPFMFTMSVNRAPTFIRRRQFLEIGGINQKYAPFQFDDDDACIRAWLAGYKVGLYACPFIRDFDVGGMTIFNNKRRKEQIIINAKKLYDDYSKYIESGYLQKLIDSANSRLLPKK